MRVCNSDTEACDLQVSQGLSGSTLKGFSETLFSGFNCHIQSADRPTQTSKRF